MGILNNILYLCWDVEGVLYKAPSEMIDEITEFYIKELSSLRSIPYSEAYDIFNKQMEISGSKQKAFIDLGYGSLLGEMKKKIGNVDLESKYIKRDEKLIETFNQLKNYQHIILSNQTKESIDKVLRLVGISQDIFHKIFSIDDFVDPKPSLNGFWLLLNHTSASPEKHVYIGDRYNVDIQPAKSVGMKTVFIGENSPKTDVDIELSSVYDIPASLY